MTDTSRGSCATCVPSTVDSSDGADRVLIVDDEKAVREVFRRTLLFAGFAVVAAAGAREGLALLAADARIKLVLLDLNMPVVSGWDFRRIQLADPRLARVPTVIATGQPVDPVGESELQPAGILHKPFGKDVLLSVVGKYCRPIPEVRSIRYVADGGGC